MQLTYTDFETGFRHVWDGDTLTCIGDEGEQRFEQPVEPLASVAFAFLDVDKSSGQQIIVLHVNGATPQHLLEVIDFTVTN